MTQASIEATDTSTLLYAHPGIALGALGMLAAGAASAVTVGAWAANLSVGAGLADPAQVTLVTAAVGTWALLTMVGTQRFIRRQQAGAAG